MAILIRGSTTCSLCGNAINSGDYAVSFPHFIHDRSHPLWRFSDSSMHRSCFNGWAKAEEFRRAHNEIWSNLKPNHPRKMLRDGSIIPEK